MSQTIHLRIDGRDILTTRGRMLYDVARENHIFIPILCYCPQKKRAVGTCRACTVNVNGRTVAACTTQAEAGMNVIVDSPELNDQRLAIIELLFISGNHLCPSCEKSGRCELQELAYREGLVVPRFPFQYPRGATDFFDNGMVIDHNRCILCKRCVDQISVDGKRVFSFRGRGQKMRLAVDCDVVKKMDHTTVKAASDLCPVGAILREGKGFDEAIGERRSDHWESTSGTRLNEGETS